MGATRHRIQLCSPSRTPAYSRVCGGARRQWDPPEFDDGDDVLFERLIRRKVEAIKALREVEVSEVGHEVRRRLRCASWEVRWQVQLSQSTD